MAEAENHKTFDEAYVTRLREEKRLSDEKFSATARERDELKQRLADYDGQEAERARKTLEAKGEYDTARAGYEKTISDKDAEIANLKGAHTKELNAILRGRILDKAEVIAARLGMHDPSDVGKFIEVKDLRLGDDGSISGLEDRVSALKESKTFLFKAEGQNLTNGNGQRAGASPGGGGAGGGEGGGIDLSQYDSATAAKLKAVMTV